MPAPYAFIRHPIYTGLVIALLATAAVAATVPALLGSVLMTFGFWLKARAEEENRTCSRFLPCILPPRANGRSFHITPRWSQQKRSGRMRPRARQKCCSRRSTISATGGGSRPDNQNSSNPASMRPLLDPKSLGTTASINGARVDIGDKFIHT